MNQKEKTITEAYCYNCGQVWSSHDFYQEDVGKKHAKETGHMVRVVIHTIKIYNQNGNGQQETK